MSEILNRISEVQKMWIEVDEGGEGTHWVWSSFNVESGLETGWIDYTLEDLIEFVNDWEEVEGGYKTYTFDYDKTLDVFVPACVAKAFFEELEELKASVKNEDSSESTEE